MVNVLSDYSSYLPRLTLKYQPIVRKKHNLKLLNAPYGYTQSPQDKLLWLPDYEILFALEKAIEFVQAGCTLRSAQEWLVETTGKRISHVGLFKIMKREYYKHEKKKLGGKYLRKSNKEKIEAKLNEA